ncbi:carboxypeptidase-like regulatory domain-containing protein [Acidobacteriota bacterium]
MRHKSFVLFSILILTIFAMQCGQSSDPTSPGMVTAQAGDAMLEGSVTASGANPVDFNQVEIGVKGTDMETQPDQNGNFRLAGLPSGNVTVEINVKNTVSDLALDNVKSREEIKAQIEINDNNEAQWCHMERNRKAEADLQLEIRPQKWNVDWVNSPDEDTACFRIYGDGVEDIDPDSVVITCVESGIAVAHPNYTSELGGVYLKVFITQKAAIDLVPDAKRGEVYNFEVTFKKVGENDLIFPPLTGKISIVGQKSGEGEVGPLTVKISPKKWNTSWTKTNGQVTVQIRGEGFDKILSDTFTLSCELNILTSEVFRFSLGGSHFSAKLSKQDALTLIDDPMPGMKCDILVYAEFEGGGDPLSETYVIEIVGKKEKD